MKARQLTLEITESLLVEKPDTSARLLTQIKELGIGIALDDFGTGYSSLTYLKHFPIDTLKIDQSFVRNVANDSGDAAMVKAIIGLAQNLQLSVTAEGIETREQLAFLRAHGCDTGQGYLFSRPLPARALAALLASGTEYPGLRELVLPDVTYIARA